MVRVPPTIVIIEATVVSGSVFFASPSTNTVPAIPGIASKSCAADLESSPSIVIVIAAIGATLNHAKTIVRDRRLTPECHQPRILPNPSILDDLMAASTLGYSASNESR
ncbi:hypothetical protein J0895_15660 [Phormidium pseudopriestleyi FRX01]|uniref:Secreted protein n=1 Tax=Phormidium pseudopriestleyi FRX01 TaxID=1759528 RepID=A0ABS3FTP7_9CYAN|nr:hypothetical protein [Phormidium pseudopriestleyi FRX01]